MPVDGFVEARTPGGSSAPRGRRVAPAARRPAAWASAPASGSQQQRQQAVRTAFAAFHGLPSPPASAALPEELADQVLQHHGRLRLT
jgi:hypothetical protein